MKISGFIAGMFLLVGTCQAITAVGTPAEGNLPGTGVYSGIGTPLSSSFWVAVGITTGSTEVQFTSLEGEFSNTSGQSTFLDGGIFSNASGAPGTLIGTFNNDALGITNAPSDAPFNADPEAAVIAVNETFTTTATVDLQANTSYWFVVASVGNATWRADSANSNSGTVPTAENASGFSLIGYDRSITSGGNWTALSGDPTVELDVTALPSSGAPEPSSIFLILSGCVCLFLSRRLSLTR